MPAPSVFPIAGAHAKTYAFQIRQIRRPGPARAIVSSSKSDHAAGFAGNIVVFIHLDMLRQLFFVKEKSLDPSWYAWRRAGFSDAAQNGEILT